VDRRQRLSGPVRLAVHEVQRGVGLHVDHRDVVRQDVVQVAGDADALLACPPLKLIFPATRGGRSALPAHPDQLGDCQQHQQPRGDTQGNSQVGMARPTDQPRRPEAHRVADDQRRNGRRPAPEDVGADEGDDQAEPTAITQRPSA
jgi:hypothetical protein